MIENEHEFRRLVAGLKIDAEPNPAHRQRLRRQMLQTFEQAARFPRWVTPLVKVSIAKLAVAAAIVLGAAAVFYQLRSPTDAIVADIAKTRQAMARMDWIHVVTTKGQEIETRWHDLTADRVFLTTAQGTVMCWDNGPAQRQLIYNPRARTLTVDSLPRRGFHGSGSVFAMLDTILARRQQDAAAVKVYMDSSQDRKVKVFRAEMMQADGPRSIQRDGVEVAVARVVEMVTVDPKTRLVLAGSTDYFDAGGDMIARERFDVDHPQTGPASVYDLGVPASARIIDRTQQPIGTPGDIPTPAPTGE